MKRVMNNKGFTLIELLAVITIMGILMAMSVMAYSSIVVNQRKEIYVDDANIYTETARNLITQGVYDVSDIDTTYYIHAQQLSENGEDIASPWALFKEAYVVVVKDTEGVNHYYWVSLDEAGWRIDLNKIKLIEKKHVYNDPTKRFNNRQPIDGRKNIVVYDKTGTRTEAKPFWEMTLEEGERCYGIEDVSDTEVRINNYKADVCGTDVIVPAYIDGKKVTEIGNNTYYNRGITSVYIPDTIKKIAGAAFQKNKLTKIEIPSSVTEIGGSAFAENKISSLILPEGLKTLGQGAFQHNNIGEAIIPDSVTSIGACSYCNNPIPNPNFLYAKSNGVYDYSKIRGYIGNLEEFTDKKFIIPASNNGVALKTIESNAFQSMTLSGWEVVIPSSVTSLGGGSFSASGIAKVNFSELTNLKTIGASAFYNNNLTSLNLPSSLTSIGAMAFNKNSVSDAEAFVYARTSSGIDYTTLVSYAGAKRSNIVIPASKNGVNLLKLGDSAFKYCYLSGSIVIPSTVTYIGSQVFCLNYISKVDNGDGVFVDGFVYARKADGSIDYTNILTYSNSNSNVVVPDGVKTISSGAFYYTYIKSVQFPEGLVTIGSSAFDICAISGTVVIPSTVEYIGDNAFRKEVQWNSFNAGLNKIVNKTGRAFDWKKIIKGSKTANFVTGIAKNAYGDVEITAE